MELQKTQAMKGEDGEALGQRRRHKKSLR